MHAGVRLPQLVLCTGAVTRGLLTSHALPPAGKEYAPMFAEYTHWAPQQWATFARIWNDETYGCVKSSFYYG